MCTICRFGYSGKQISGVGIEFARNYKQVRYSWEKWFRERNDLWEKWFRERNDFAREIILREKLFCERNDFAREMISREKWFRERNDLWEKWFRERNNFVYLWFLFCTYVDIVHTAASCLYVFSLSYLII